MLVLGISGNFSDEEADLIPGQGSDLFHDAAACLIRDGKTIAAAEEERFNRIKQTTKFPVNAIRACLDTAEVSPAHVEAVGYFFQENFVDWELTRQYIGSSEIPVRYSRDLITDNLRRRLDFDIPGDCLIYAEHHLTHAMSCFLRSGMREALVVVMDGRGEQESTTIFHGADGKLVSLAAYNVPKSLGLLYLSATRMLGYRLGDEYKVMGLAPYGNPGTYRDLFTSLYTLKDRGDYELRPLPRACFDMGIKPRRKGESFTRQHADLAAALQEAVETITMHILRYWAERTGLARLCFVGGVAHNSSLNGAILRSGIFGEVFIPSAAHDAGAAEGAALAAAAALGAPGSPQPRQRSASLGPDLGSVADIAKQLANWGDLIEWEEPADVVESAAALLAEGAVLGWAHGQSEYGPRALGNRSILADARPSGNRGRINSMVKKRESYRPFAPVVTPAAAAAYFDLPQTRANYDFMSFVVSVRAERRAELGAVTHVDGSARLQVIDPVANERFHRLVERFGELTGTPVLLNTSFNNNAEPIVQSVHDVVTCFLTTELDFLIIENFLVRRRPGNRPALDGLIPALRPTTRLVRRSRMTTPGSREVIHEIYLDSATRPRADLSPAAFALLDAADGMRTLGSLVGRGGLGDDLSGEIYGLWQGRFFTLRPAPRQSR